MGIINREQMRVWVETREPGFVGRVFHIFDGMLKSGFATVFHKAAREKKTIDDVSPSFPLGTVGIMLILLLLFRFLIHVPIDHNGIPVLSGSIWIGILSFIGACALGYGTLSPWLAKVYIRGLVGLLSGAYRAEVIGVHNEGERVSPQDFDDQLDTILSEQRDTAIEKITARYMFQGGLLLFGVIVAMPTGIWLSVQWKSGVLVAITFGLIRIVWDFFNSGLLTYSDFLWDFYRVLKEEHKGIQDKCPVCNASLPPVVASAHSSSGWGLTFMLTGLWIYPLVRLTCKPNPLNSGGAYISSEWTWILLFLPGCMVFLSKMLKWFRRMNNNRRALAESHSQNSITKSLDSDK